MSLYVVPENQELLWNVISKNIYIQDFFAPYNSEKKNEWFKTIIRSFYEKYKMQKLSVADLNTINKETISYMIQNIRSQINEPVVKTTPPSQTIPSYEHANTYTITTPPIIPNTRQDIYAKQFEQRQQEYANLNKKHIPTDVDFTEKMDDGVLQNMDELVKQQMQQRAYEMSMIPAPTNIAPPKLQIDASSNIEISIQEINSPQIKKGVTWKDDTPISKSNTESAIHIISGEVQDLRTTIETITQEMTVLTEFVKIIQLELSVMKQSNADLTVKYNTLLQSTQTHVNHEMQSNQEIQDDIVNETIEHILNQLEPGNQIHDYLP